MLFVSSSPPAKGQGYGGYGYYAPVLGVPAYGVNTTVVGYNNVVQTNVYQAPAVDYFGGTVIQTGYQNVDQYTGYNYDYLIQDVTPKQNSSNGGRYVTEDYYRPIDYSKYFE